MQKSQEPLRSRSSGTDYGRLQSHYHKARAAVSRLPKGASRTIERPEQPEVRHEEKRCCCGIYVSEF